MSHATKTLQLYQEVLEDVAQGRLPATVFQEYFPRFIQSQGTRYSDRLTELGSEFLTSLVQLNRRNSQGDEAEDAEGEIPLPIFERANATQWFEQYAEFLGQINARAVKAYRKQLDQVAVGEATPEDIQKKVASQMSHQLPDYLQRVGHLYFGLMNRLNEIRANYEEEYFLGILALAKRSESEPSVTMELSGPLGGMAFATFTLTNTTGHRTPIRYVGTEVRRTDGVGATFAPQIVIQPEALELGPGEDATISFSLQLQADRYEVDIPYLGFLYITGDGDLRVEMRLRIIANQPTLHET